MAITKSTKIVSKYDWSPLSLKHNLPSAFATALSSRRLNTEDILWWAVCGNSTPTMGWNACCMQDGRWENQTKFREVEYIRVQTNCKRETYILRCRESAMWDGLSWGAYWHVVLVVSNDESRSTDGWEVPMKGVKRIPPMQRVRT